MGKGGTAPGDEQVLDLLGNEAAVGDVVVVLREKHRAVAPRRVVDVDRVAGDGDDILEPAARQDILCGQDIFPDHDPALADSEEGGYLLDLQVLETGDIFPEVFVDPVHLPACFDLAEGVALRPGRIDAADPGHVDPDLVVFQTRDEDRPGDRDVQSGRIGLVDLVPETDGDEIALCELFGRHDVHVEDVTVVDEGVAETGHVHLPDGVHQGRGLHAAVLVALVHLDTGACRDITVSGAVDHRLGEDDLASGLALDDDALYGIPVHDHVGAEDIHQHFDPGFFHHFKGNGLDLFGIDDRQAHMVLAGDVRACAAPGREAVDQVLGISPDALFSVDVEIGEDRKTQGQVSAQVSPAFDEQDLVSFPGGGAGSHDPGGTASDDQDVDFGPYGKLPLRFEIRFHATFQLLRSV